MLMHSAPNTVIASPVRRASATLAGTEKISHHDGGGHIKRHGRHEQHGLHPDAGGHASQFIHTIRQSRHYDKQGKIPSLPEKLRQQGRQGNLEQIGGSPAHPGGRRQNTRQRQPGMAQEKQQQRRPHADGSKG